MKITFNNGDSLVEMLRGALREPLEALLGADKRIFLPFLASSAVIAAIVWAQRVRRHGRTTLLGFLFPRSIWLHRSAILDYQILFARALLKVVLFAPFFVSTIGVALAVTRVLRHSFGTIDTSLSRGPVAALFTVSAFVADDFTRYCVHWLLHRVPWLWEIHKVHHSAEVMTPFTLHRVHPLEGFAMAVRASITIGAVTGLFIWMFPGRVQGWEILGVDAVSFAFALFGANLRHSQVWWSYGPKLERIFISPAQHQIHHSDDPRHFNRNLGAALAIWDWAFGTLYLIRGREPLRFGLPAEVRNHENSVVSSIVGPLVASVRTLVPSRLARPRPQPGE